MKFKILLGIAISLFVLSSLFSYIKYKEVERKSATIAKIELQYDQAQKEIDKLKSSLVSKDDSIKVLTTQKESAVKELAKYKAEIKKQIADFEVTIASLNTIPTDTLYKSLFNKWSSFDIVNDTFVEYPLLYKFAKPHINGIYLGLLERDNFELLYSKTANALTTSEYINDKNDRIITTLKGKVGNLNEQLDYTSIQNGLLNDKVVIADKTLKKQKRKTFLYQSTTVVAITGIIWSLIK